jgi:uncharacterized protein
MDGVEPPSYSRAVIVGLVLTHACNLACGYCYTGEKKRVRMAPEVASRAVQRALDEAGGEPLVIQFFGGEPLLEYDLVVRIATEARGRDADVAFQVTTNGTLLDRERVAELGELGVHIALSLDGTAEAHDRGRPLAGGGPSHHLARRALDCLLASGRPFDVISVLDPATIDLAADGVRELLDRGVERLTLNPNWSAAWSPDALERWRAAYERIGAIVVAWFRRGRAVAVQPFDSALVTLARGEAAAAHACRAGVGAFAVGPSGRLYACTRAVGTDSGERAIGDLAAGLDGERVARFGAPACPGACSCASFEETGTSAMGPVQAWHAATVADVAARMARALERDGADIHRRVFGAAPLEPEIA